MTYCHTAESTALSLAKQQDSKNRLRHPPRRPVPDRGEPGNRLMPSDGPFHGHDG